MTDDAQILRDCVAGEFDYRLPNGDVIRAKVLGFLDAMELLELRAIAESGRAPTDRPEDDPGWKSADEAFLEASRRFPAAIGVDPKALAHLSIGEVFDVMQDFFMYRRSTSNGSSDASTPASSDGPTTPISPSTTSPRTAVSP